MCPPSIAKFGGVSLPTNWGEPSTHVLRSGVGAVGWEDPLWDEGGWDPLSIFLATLPHLEIATL